MNDEAIMIRPSTTLNLPMAVSNHHATANDGAGNGSGAGNNNLTSRPEYVPNFIFSDPFYVRILDTTLRDGEHAPGAAMTMEQKLAVARLLSNLGVDVIDVGFPRSSPESFNSSKAIASEVGCHPVKGHVPVISVMARCNKKDIDVAWEAVQQARRPSMVIFIATSEIHMKHKLRMSKAEVLNTAAEMVAYARSLGCQDVAFGAEDAGRSDKEFLYHILNEAIKAGASTLIIPDIVGYNLPSKYGNLIANLRANTAGAIIFAHCHNDLGLATPNTLAVVMAIKCRRELLGGLHTGIDTRYIAESSKMVAEFTGLYVQPHKAIVRINAFTHESGIHQDGVLKFTGTYEILSPEDIGLSRSSESGIKVGKLSGRHGLKFRLWELGYDINGKELDDIFARFKEIAGTKKNFSDEDIEALVHENGHLQVMHVTLGLPTVTVKLISCYGEEKISCSVGEGPVDAAYKAVNNIVQIPVVIRKYVNSAMEGIDSLASTQVVVSQDSNEIVVQNVRTFSGSATGKDIVIASVQAYLNALNKVVQAIDSSTKMLSA